MVWMLVGSLNSATVQANLSDLYDSYWYVHREGAIEINWERVTVSRKQQVLIIIALVLPDGNSQLAYSGLFKFSRNVRQKLMHSGFNGFPVALNRGPSCLEGGWGSWAASAPSAPFQGLELSSRWWRLWKPRFDHQNDGCFIHGYSYVLTIILMLDLRCVCTQKIRISVYIYILVATRWWMIAVQEKPQWSTNKLEADAFVTIGWAIVPS